MTRNYKKQQKQMGGEGGGDLLLVSRIVGYARVSTEEQVLDVQMTALKNAKCDHVFIEKISAVNAKRPEFNLMIKFLEAGDTVIVHSLSRLGRKAGQIHDILKSFDAIGIKWRSITEPHLNTSTASGRLMVNVTSAMAQFERDQVVERTILGMAELKRQGVYLGRPRVVALKDIPKMQAMRDRGIRVSDIADKFRCSTPCVYAHTTSKAA